MRIAYWLVAVGIVACWPIGSARLAPAWAGQPAAQPDPATPPSQPTRARTRSGLLALYDFRLAEGAIVKDRSGVGKPLDLRITNPKAVRRSEGSLEVLGQTRIRSDGPAAKIIQSIRRSREITIEAWVRPANTSQNGPARIVTLSRNGNERNFTLGQQRDRFDVRFRTTQTNANGIPSLSSADKSLTAQLTHVVFTRDRTGRTRIYLNGRRSVEWAVSGATRNWIGSHRLALANELNDSRPWQGTYYLVAVYHRDLLPQEVRQNFQAGADAQAAPGRLAQTPPATSDRFFDAHIAPLLARHCLECHDSASKKGGLDLSRKVAALAGGESGKVIVPGKPAESLLWERIDSGDMPPEGEPLSAQDKTRLRQWIDNGAVWSKEVIDPVVYAHDSRVGDIWVRRLTVPEYIETVRGAVGVDIQQDARRILPKDLRADGFSNTAYNLNVDLKHVEAYARLAEIIVGRMDVLKFAARFSKSRKLSTDATMRQFVASMGKWLLRGPLDEREVTTYGGIATTVASAGGDYKEAVSYLIEAMLQSPRFIYRIENQRGDGTAWPVGEYELASRLSYILWGGPPDQELMRAADAGELHDRGALEKQVRRMLRDPRAVRRSSQFVYEWLDLGRLDHLRPDPQRFPQWNERLAADMREETLAFFEDVVWKQQRPLWDVLNAQLTYATPRLADYYGLGSKGDPRSKGDELTRYDLSSLPARGGLLTQGSVLTIGGDDASMVTRGLFILHDLLRGTVKDPPPGLDTTPVPTRPGLTQRQIALQRIADASCRGCHSKFEPLAFGLEKFDGLGAFHDMDEHGNELRDDGEILFPGAAKPVKYKSSAQLMNLLAGSERVQESITWKVAQFALGRPLVAADARTIEKIHQSAQQGGGTYSALITAIVMSDLVQLTPTEIDP